MKKILLLLTLGFLATIRTNADVLANYPFTGSLRVSTDTDLFSTASSITDGSGLTSSIDTTRGNPSPAIAIVSTDTDGSTNAAAVTANDYISFTLTPLAGFALDLSSLTVDAANYTNDGTFSAESFFLRSSANSFSSNINSTVNIAAGSNGAFANSSFTLTGASFQNLTTPIEFRIYFQDSISDADRGILLDNIIVNGTSVSAIPEPTTSMLLGLGVLIGAQQLIRRRRVS